MWAFRAVRLGGRMAAGDALPRLLLGERAVLLAAVAGVTLVAWLYLLHLGHDMGGMADMGGMPDMAGMAMVPGWTPATAVLTLAMWVVMMTGMRSEEHTSELQSLMRISYAVFCLKKQTRKTCIAEQKYN